MSKLRTYELAKEFYRMVLTLRLAPELSGQLRAKSLQIPTNITLCHLPPYSPELNPIERLWLWLKDRLSLQEAQSFGLRRLKTTPEPKSSLKPPAPPPLSDTPRPSLWLL